MAVSDATSMSSSMTTAEQQLKEASWMLNWAIICLQETALEYAPCWTSEEIDTLPRAYRLRFNRHFIETVRKFQNEIKQNDTTTT
jgi:hypothetical protein